MMTLTLIIGLFFSTLAIYVVKAWKKYKKNPKVVKEALKENFGIEVEQPSNNSNAKRLAANNNRKNTKGRRWQYINIGQEFTRRIHHDYA